MKAYSLFDLNQFIRRIIALNLAEPIWVQCEIAQCNESRGHYWLELVQKGAEADDIIAQASAVIWSRKFRQLRKELGPTFQQLLQEGMEVKIKAKVDFNERYGLKLMVEDIDPDYTLGQLAIQRQRILAQLKEEDLLGRNALLPMPTVVQRIAVISSAKAAGYQDFVEQLNGNAYDYAYQLRFFPSVMQGVAVEKELLRQLKQIEKRATEFDTVVIIRGGGSKLDLQAFDNYQLGKAIAEMSLPVLVGIGHDIDETVLDTVAYRSLKTPTAVADFLIHQNEQFEVQLQQLALRLQQSTYLHLREQNLTVDRLGQSLRLEVRRFLEQEKARVDHLAQQTRIVAPWPLHQAQQQLAELKNQIQLYDPKQALDRGFVQVSDQAGKRIKSVRELSKDEIVQLHFSDGIANAKIENNE